jgi:hypothetical protein
MDEPIGCFLGVNVVGTTIEYPEFNVVEAAQPLPRFVSRTIS